MKNILITGGSSGIGFATASKLYNDGHSVIIASRDISRVSLPGTETLTNENQSRFFTRQCDVREPSQVNNLISDSIKLLGHLDVLVNCAGLSVHGKFDDISVEDWDEVIDTNLKGVFLCCKAVWSHMKSNAKGQIVTVSSASGLKGYKTGSIYCASKFGLNGFLESLAFEGQDHNIKITTICPGQVNTNAWNANDPIVNQARENMLHANSVADLISYCIDRPSNEHIKNIILTPFSPQPDLTGRNRGPSSNRQFQL